jgi:hypothetical protein
LHRERRDNVLRLRILAAAMVIFGHSFAIVGSEVGTRATALAVSGHRHAHRRHEFFFTISGLPPPIRRSPSKSLVVRAHYRRSHSRFAFAVA